MSEEAWRSRTAYTYANSMDAAGLAWEFLRRNTDYRAIFEDAAGQADHGPNGPARRWGLRFPGRPEPARR